MNGRIVVLSLIALVGWQARAADPRFNGRWDITILGEPRTAAWVEITGAETDKPAGRFVSAFGGDMNVIERISFSEGALRFGWPERGLMYTARVAGRLIEGTREPDKRKWVAVRAPVLKDRDDGTWRDGKPVTLFNGKDLSGWKPVAGKAVKGWTVRDGLLVGSGAASNIISESKFWNCKLHVEYRIQQGSNSGIGLRGRYEVQILDDAGKPANSHSSGALYSRIAPSRNAAKPAGEWQTYDIRLVGRQVTVVLNDQKVIDRGEVEGLTAIAIDSNEAAPGPLYLQGDHGPVEFRSIVVTPLVH